MLVSIKHGQHWQSLWLASSASMGSPGRRAQHGQKKNNHIHHLPPATQLITILFGGSCPVHLANKHTELESTKTANIVLPNLPPTLH